MNSSGLPWVLAKPLKSLKTAMPMCCLCMPPGQSWSSSRPGMALTAVRSCNDALIVGPASDPAGVKGQPTAEALKRILKPGQLPGRGDQSGTHKAEQKLWQKSNIAPDKDPKYFSAGQGMIATLNMAAEKQAYALTDRGTWITFADKMGDKNPLAIMVEGDKALFNQYSVITVNPAQCPKVKTDLSKKFEDWWVAPATQQRIAGYMLKGKQLFFPNAGK